MVTTTQTKTTTFPPTQTYTVKLPSGNHLICNDDANEILVCHHNSSRKIQQSRRTRKKFSAKEEKTQINIVLYMNNANQHCTGTMIIAISQILFQI